MDQDLVVLGGLEPNWLVIISTSFAFIAGITMIFFYGRGNFRAHEIFLYRRRFLEGEKPIDSFPLPLDEGFLKERKSKR